MAKTHLLKIMLLSALTLSLPINAAPLPVVASFSLLGDMTKQVGGERVAVRSLVGCNSDAHVFQPTPNDAKTLANARLVIVNGLGFEGWIDRLIKAAGNKNKVLVASTGIVPLMADEEEHAEHSEDAGNNAAHANLHNAADPHAWQDLSLALKYVDNIVNALIHADPAGKDFYLANAKRYKSEIVTLNRAIKTELHSLPDARQRVVSSHDAFAYFSRAYGIHFIAPVGLSTDAEASAADMARILRQIRAEKIPAVFLENISNPRLLDQLRRESGAKIGGTLYADALACDGDASSYLGLMKQNATLLFQALKP